MKSVFCAIPILALPMLLQSAEWHVAPDGSNINTGTRQHPLQTIQAAVDRMKQGDVCVVHRGIYRETVQINQLDVSVIAAPGEQVILDGTDTISGKWTKYKGSIYWLAAPKGIEQIFIGKQMMIEARWPNMKFEQRFDRSRWAQVDSGSEHGRVLSDAIARTGIDCTGATACLNVAHQWWTWNRQITKHRPGSNVLEYPADLVGLCNFDPAVNKDKAWLTQQWADDYFYLTGKLEFLDVETEWFQDQKTGTLYLFAPGGVDPTALPVHYRARNYAISAQGNHNLRIEGFKFFAATFRLDDCDHCTVEDSELLYPSFSRTITEYDQNRRESVFTKITGNYNTVRHVSLAYANNLGLMVMGNNNTVENSIIHDVNWYGTLIYPALQLSASPHLGVNWFDTIQYPPTERTIRNSDVTSFGNVAKGNTLYNGGSSLLVYQAAGSIVEYNHVYDGGLASKDCSLVYGCWPFSRGSIVRNNWVHGCVTDSYDGRGGHGGIGIRADDQSRSNTFHHNVVWDCGQIGIIMKGEDHRLFNNTVFNVGTRESPQMDIIVETIPEPFKIWAVQWPQLLKQNQWTEVFNNLARTITASHKINDLLKDSARVHDNIRGQDVQTLLLDSAKRDFRPKSAPGLPANAGAYEAGANPWSPGATWKESFTDLSRK